MPRAVPPDVAAHVQPLLPSCVARVSRWLRARGREFLASLPELQVVSVPLGVFAASLDLDRLTVVRA
eukprot:5274532-Alexandrium_andersonii.AAC.1